MDKIILTTKIFDALSLAEGRLSNGATPKDVFEWLKDEIIVAIKETS